MSKKRKSVALTMRLPKSLMAEVRRLAPRSFRGNDSRIIERALRRWVEERKEHLVDLEITRMGKDPNVIADCKKINKEFSVTDSDGLEGL